MNKFDILEPRTVSEAVEMLQRHGSAARPLAGGTDLMVAIKLKHLQPRYLINLKCVPDLDGISLHGGGLLIGALTRVADVATSDLVRRQYPMLASAAGELGSVQVRNVATVGGNLCNASPSADTVPALIALGAEARIVGPAGERFVQVESLFCGPGQTTLSQGEVLTHLRLPAPEPGSGGCYLKRGTRKSMDCAVVGVAAWLMSSQPGSVCGDVRIVLGAVAPTPLRAVQAEGSLQGQAMNETLWNQAGMLAASESRPIDDVRGTAAYRREMLRVLVPRAIEKAWSAALAGGWSGLPAGTLVKAK